ncbi:MAG: SPOR domain-containing protein [bacterium]
MKKLIIQISIFLLFVGRLFSQEPDIDLNKLLHANNPDELAQKIQSFIIKNRGTALALYLEAVTETNATQAVEKYKQLLSKFPNSDYAAIALLKTAQYYFSRGLYITARKYYLELVEKYPHSSFIDDAMYFAAACLYASGKYESCYAELKNFLVQNPHSSFTKLAKEDLKEINKKYQFSKLKFEIANAKGKYALQIGAFNQVNNALNLKNYCQKLGLPVEVREKNESNTTMYLVWIGAFESRESALNFGNKFKKEYGKPFRIVSR